MSTLAKSLVCQSFDFSWPKPLGIDHLLAFLSEIAGGPCLNLPEHAFSDLTRVVLCEVVLQLWLLEQ